MDAPNDTPTPPASPFSKPLSLAMAGAGLVLTVALTVAFSKLPPEYRVWNLSVIGAVALFTAARLGFWSGVVFTAVAIGLKDLCLYYIWPEWQPYPLTWVYFTGYVLLGWLFLRRSASVGRAVGVALGGGLLFFLVSNFGSWVEQALPYGYSLRGLIDCYVAAIPFYRGTFLGDVVFTAAFFGAHAILSRVYFPAERVNPVMEEVRDQDGNW
jgi:hypothetical protein